MMRKRSLKKWLTFSKILRNIVRWAPARPREGCSSEWELLACGIFLHKPKKALLQLFLLMKSMRLDVCAVWVSWVVTMSENRLSIKSSLRWTALNPIRPSLSSLPPTAEIFWILRFFVPAGLTGGWFWIFRIWLGAKKFLPFTPKE